MFTSTSDSLSHAISSTTYVPATPAISTLTELVDSAPITLVFYAPNLTLSTPIPTIFDLHILHFHFTCNV